MPDRDKFFEFESRVDTQVEGSLILQLPLPNLLVLLFYILDGRTYGNRREPKKPDIGLGEEIASRISYALRFYAKKLIPSARIVPWEFASQQLADQITCAELQLLAGYLHFCELVPEVRRGQYNVRAEDPEAFRLFFPDEKHTRFEMLDLLATELSLTHVSGDYPGVAHFFHDSSESATENGPAYRAALTVLHNYYMNAVHEAPIATDVATTAAAGVSRREFASIRAALMATADMYTWRTLAIQHGILEGHLPVTEESWEQLFSSVIPALAHADFLRDITMLSGIAQITVANALKPFTTRVDPNGSVEHGGGDGFLPPVITFGEQVLFHPLALKAMLPTRNILYFLNRRDRSTFNDVVSRDLEPVLIQNVCRLLEDIPDLQLHMNASSPSGEIDLLVVDRSSGSCLIVQAKAPIPPQGARMVTSVGDRIREGIEQINRFRAIPDAEQQSWVRKYIPNPSGKVKFGYAILSRANMGNAWIWMELEKEKIAPITLASVVYLRQVLINRSVTLSAMADTMWTYWNTLLDNVKPTIHEEEFPIGSTRIIFPKINFDRNALNEIISGILASVGRW